MNDINRTEKHGKWCQTESGGKFQTFGARKKITELLPKTTRTAKIQLDGLQLLFEKHLKD